MNRRTTRTSLLLGALALSLWAAGKGQAAVTETFSDFVMRGNLMRSYAKFSAGGPARVAFLGGSVTYGSWRDIVMKALREKFPTTQFDFINAAVGGTDANLGAFRFERDVLSRGPVDLLFLEFAVNGGGVRPMEGIVRHAQRQCPGIDILLTYFAATDKNAEYARGQVPGIVKDHEQVAERYGLPSLWFYREVAKRVKDGTMPWKDFSGDSVHPNQHGNELYGAWYVSFLTQAWADPKLKPAAPTTPEPIDKLCYEGGRFIAPDQAVVARGFALHRGWKPEKTCNFSPPVDVLEATEPGAELRLDFKGTTIGMYMIAGFDAGIIECSIDGAAFKAVDLFDMPWCTMFHRPVHRLLSDSLPAGAHQLVVRVTDRKHAKSTGTAVRVLQFMANG